MGSGKTTIGRLVAQMLGWSFVDSDDEIVERTGRTIPEIFAAQGEAGFRALEREVCRALAQRENCVIATGGGMLVDEINRAVMAENGFVVCLDATLKDIQTRLAESAPHERPLFSGDWQALYARRQPAYAAIREHVSTSGKTPEQVAREVVNLWQNKFA